MKKLLQRIYHSIISWRSVTKFGNDFFIEINNELYSLIMLKPDQVDKNKIKKIRNTYKDFCAEETSTLLLNNFKFSRKLKNSFIMFFDSNGKLLCLCNNYSQGFKEVSDLDKIYFMNMKKYRTGFTNNFYYLKKLTIKNP